MEDTKFNKVPRLMSREMLEDLVNLVKPHKEEYPELYNYLMLTWSSCHYDSTLYACNITGMTMTQRHLSFFDDECIRFLKKEINNGKIQL
jgi:hypothetical protein